MAVTCSSTQNAELLFPHVGTWKRCRILLQNEARPPQVDEREIKLAPSSVFFLAFALQ